MAHAPDDDNHERGSPEPTPAGNMTDVRMEVPLHCIRRYRRVVSDDQQVLAAARLRAQALVDGDSNRLTQLMHPDLRWTTFRGELLDRDTYVRGNTDGSLRWIAQTLEDPDVVAVGDTAVLVAVVTDTVERDGAARTFRLRLTQTWVRAADGWQCLAGHAGPLLDA